MSLAILGFENDADAWLNSGGFNLY